MTNKVYIIAEAGVNHNGDINLAKKLIDVAFDCGVDAVKFQIFIPSELVCIDAKKAEYQNKNDSSSNSQIDMLNRLVLSYEQFKTLKEYCNEKHIEFLATAFDLGSLTFLLSLNINTIKIPSGEITNLLYLIKCAESHLPIFLSTGMCDLQEIYECVKVLKEHGAGEITLLHCTTEYPAPLEQINLNAIKTLAKEFMCEVGYSDHTAGILAPVIAVSLGAAVIEKHFTLDRNMEGPDHKASLEPSELKQMVDAIRSTEKALGSGEKIACVVEEKNKIVARKSIVAKEDIKKGEIFAENNITAKRPGNGISPMKWFEVLGTKAIKNFNKDELIEL